VIVGLRLQRLPTSGSPASSGVAACKLEWAAPARTHAGTRPDSDSWRAARGAPSGRKALRGAEGASRAERASASSSPPIAVIEGDGRVKVWVLHFVTGLQRPSYQDPPGSRVLLGGSWPSWAIRPDWVISAFLWKC